ncbi:repressor LexA [Candidatus Shapirobacteria bacterium CG10_big_fil_rev_8_21_14_0_10_38_14]|uniref:LexA repressor n=1 Tax=Candidatus Shapirobacteria bacterium CG10_big_fil_rev_8_21_14_0_10_38_14 TaxID=1974483 RepID=A0A2M8L553_9BACT|nr:MAG: repressor LexA [Candidatus Shapirobacteria bacterium CG10_big_fil_rev_8_21_14_0_10_38_14]
MAAILYPRQRQILDFANQFIQRYGYAPTLIEIAQAIGVNSAATVHEHLKLMVKRGFIRREVGNPRSIEIVKSKDRVEDGIELPILGFIAAGQPIEPYTDPNAAVYVAPSMLSGKKSAFVLQVKGSSMIEEGILDGDYVVIEEQNIADNGDIVVAVLDNGFATLKRFFKEATRVRLEPANSQMTPIFAKSVKIQGKVIGVIRRYAS